MANTFKKSDAVDFAHNIKLLIEALVNEGFEEVEAREFVKHITIAQSGKTTTLF